jgi:hypothetical protein
VTGADPPLFRLSGKIAVGAVAAVLTLLLVDRWLRQKVFGLIKRVPVLGGVF